MHDDPTPAQLVSAVRAFLEKVAGPKLEGHAAFHARVAANALAIVERQLTLGPEQEAAEAERLREGALGLDTPGLVEHLRATTLAKLSVDQPRYSGYRRALERAEE